MEQHFLKSRFNNVVNAYSSALISLSRGMTSTMTSFNLLTKRGNKKELKVKVSSATFVSGSRARKNILSDFSKIGNDMKVAISKYESVK